MTAAKRAPQQVRFRAFGVGDEDTPTGRFGIAVSGHLSADGFVTVDSEPGRGTTFAIYLPRHVAQAGQTGTKRAEDPASRGRETVLVVEDDPAVLKMTTRMLAGQGYTVLPACSPIEAIRMAGEHAAGIHLLMTDVVMPEMNGRDLAAKLLALHPHLKRLFTSGYTADVIAHHGVLDEGVHFLPKPLLHQRPGRQGARGAGRPDMTAGRVASALTSLRALGNSQIRAL